MAKSKVGNCVSMIREKNRLRHRPLIERLEKHQLSETEFIFYCFLVDNSLLELMCELEGIRVNRYLFSFKITEDNDNKVTDFEVSVKHAEKQSICG